MYMLASQPPNVEPARVELATGECKSPVIPLNYGPKRAAYRIRTDDKTLEESYVTPTPMPHVTAFSAMFFLRDN